MAAGLIRPQPISVEELESLRTVKRGAGATTIPAAHRAEFMRRGWVEMKFGGIVLTALGRYQLDLRARATGLALIANNWQRRAKHLRELADTMRGGNANGLRDLADRWDLLAKEVSDIERREHAERSLGDGTDKPRGGDAAL